MSIDDLFEYPIELFTTAMVVLVTILFVNRFLTTFDNIAAGTDASTFVTEGVSHINRLAGYYVVGVFIAILIFSLIAAMYIPTSILNAPIFAILTLFAVWISYPFSQAYTALIETSAFASYSTYMQVTTLLMGRLPLMVLMSGCVLALATYVKYRGEQTISPT